MRSINSSTPSSSSISTWGILPSGDCEEIIRSEHVSETAIVCDEGCDDTKISSTFDYVSLLDQEAYVFFQDEPLLKVKEFR